MAWVGSESDSNGGVRHSGLPGSAVLLQVAPILLPFVNLGRAWTLLHNKSLHTPGTAVIISSFQYRAQRNPRIYRTMRNQFNILHEGKPERKLFSVRTRIFVQLLKIHIMSGYCTAARSRNTTREFYNTSYQLARRRCCRFS